MHTDSFIYTKNALQARIAFHMYASIKISESFRFLLLNTVSGYFCYYVNNTNCNKSLNKQLVLYYYEQLTPTTYNTEE